MVTECPDQREGAPTLLLVEDEPAAGTLRIRHDKDPVKAVGQSACIVNHTAFSIARASGEVVEA